MSTLDICQNRHGGNPESQAAYELLAPHLNKQTAMVVAAFCSEPGGSTVEEVETLLGISRSSVSARASELRKKGYLLEKRVEVTPKGDPAVYVRRKNRSGSWAAVLIWNEAFSPTPWLTLLEKEVAAMAGAS